MSDPLEIMAALLGFVCVALTVRRHILCWPTGIGSVVLYFAVFFEAKLYSDMLLQVVFVFLQIYGWYAWLHGGTRNSVLPIGRIMRRPAIAWLMVGIGGTAVLGGVMHWCTDASFPFIDAGVTVASLIAQWLMARKILESWLIWIAVDLTSIALFFAKELYPTTVLYAIFLAMATWGWFEWRSAWRRQATA